MKKRIAFIAACALALASLSATICAAEQKLSPAIDVIAEGQSMIKTGYLGENVIFSDDDFICAAGITPASITVTSLPPISEGTLYLGNTEVLIGQTISCSNLGLLRFEPNDGTQSSVFRFTFDRSYTTCCEIKLLSEENLSPTLSGGNVTVMTQSDITVFGTLSGSDPDGDRLQFEIVSYPTMGIVSLTDTENGSFSYTPYDGVIGVDSFSYRVRDEYGNYSDLGSVSLKIDKRISELVLADMSEHWAHNAALTMVSSGAFDVIGENGTLYFSPEEVMTREEFLKSAMKALGAGELSPTETVFADDEISDSCSGYVAAAYSLGIIKGYEADGGLYFSAGEKITRSEAAAILNRIVGAEASGTAVSEFTDVDSVPAWAAEDLNALIEAGIISGTTENMICADALLTRAEAAQMLYATKQSYS